MKTDVFHQFVFLSNFLFSKKHFCKGLESSCKSSRDGPSRPEGRCAARSAVRRAKAAQRLRRCPRGESPVTTLLAPDPLATLVRSQRAGRPLAPSACNLWPVSLLNLVCPVGLSVTVLIRAFSRVLKSSDFARKLGNSGFFSVRIHIYCII